MKRLLLQTRGLGKVYPPSTVALRDCDFVIEAGEIHGLVGVNGAGKSTLIKILAGVERPTGGTIEIAGIGAVDMTSPVDAHRCGIGVVHQELPLFDNLSVAENLFMGVEGSWLLGPLVRRRARRAYARLAPHFPGAPGPDELVGEISIGKRQIASIVRALACGARVLILDEATSSLPTAERQVLHENLRRVARDGIGILYVSHFIDDVLDVCDRVTVVRDGRLVSSVATASVTSAAQIIEAMTGQAAADQRSRSERSVRRGSTADAALSLRSFATDTVGPVDLEVAPGECVGLYGLEGCGAREVLLGAFGLVPHDGVVAADGSALRGASVTRIKAGLAMVSGDRRRTLMTQQTVRANFDLPYLANQPLVAPARPQPDRIETALGAFDVKGAPDQLLSTLSGGNQQKIALGRWLDPLPVCLLADEPTRGVDVGGRAAIHSHLGDLLDRGMAMLVNSSDPEEIVAIADRVIVLEAGSVIGELVGAEITVRAIEEATRAAHAAPQGATV